MSCGSLGKIDQATKTRALNEDEIHGRERDGSVVLLLARLPYHCMRAWAWAWVWPADVYGGRRAYATLRVAGPGGFQSPVRPAETLSASEAQDHTAYSVLLFFFPFLLSFPPQPKHSTILHRGAADCTCCDKKNFSDDHLLLQHLQQAGLAGRSLRRLKGQDRPRPIAVSIHTRTR